MESSCVCPHLLSLSVVTSRGWGQRSLRDELGWPQEGLTVKSHPIRKGGHGVLIFFDKGGRVGWGWRGSEQWHYWFTVAYNLLTVG